MNNIKMFKSIVEENIKDEIKEADWCSNLYDYSLYKCKIDGLISAAYIFCPELVQVKEYIFIKYFWDCDLKNSIEKINRLEKQYKNNKKLIEMSVNTWSLGDFFINDNRNIMENEKIIQQFGEILVYFWNVRVKELFPEKNIIVELGNDLMGEYGLCITMYEKE